MSAKFSSSFEFEQPLWRQGIARVAGVDEAGRGPLAGPVVAAAAILPPRWAESGLPAELSGLNDSKQLTAAQREKFFAFITGCGEIEFGIDAGGVAEVLQNLRLPAGRFESFEMRGGWRIIYDAYNASASGTIAALDALDDQRPERAIAVLGSMAELGEESAQLHERVGAHAAKRAGVVVVTGEYADAMARGAQRGDADVVRVGSNADAARWLRDHARRGDVVLLKGSRKYRLEEILEDLQS